MKPAPLFSVTAVAAVLLCPSATLAAPIHEAVQDTDTNRVTELLDEGTDVNARNEDDLTALHIAAQLGNVEIAGLLIAHAAEVNATGMGEIVPLHFAAASGSDELARLLLQNGAEVDARDAGDFTPLHVAAIFGSLSVAELLLDEGADVNAENDMRMTPLNMAIMQEHQALVELFEGYGGIAQQPCQTVESIEAMNQGIGFDRVVHIEGPLAKVFLALDPIWSMPDFEDVAFGQSEDMRRIREQFEYLLNADIDEVIVWQIRRDLGLGAAIAFSAGCAVEGYGEPDDLEKLELMHEAYLSVTEHGIEHATVRTAIEELLEVYDLAEPIPGEASTMEEKIDTSLGKVRPLLESSD